MRLLVVAASDRPAAAKPFLSVGDRGELLAKRVLPGVSLRPNFCSPCYPYHEPLRLTVGGIKEWPDACPILPVQINELRARRHEQKSTEILITFGRST